MKKFVALLAFVLLTNAVSAQDDRYALTCGDATGGTNDVVTVDVTLDSMAGTAGPALELQGWSYGICNDTSMVTLVPGSVMNGSTTVTVNGGDEPDFNAINDDPMPGDGFTVGVVIDFFGVNKLSPGTGYQVNTVDYTIVGAAGTTSLDFCDTLATPAVETLVVEDGGASAIPVQNSGTITIGGMVDPFRLVAGDSTGGPGATVSVAITMDNPADAEGFSYGLLNDAAVATPSGASQGSMTASTNGNMGAAFFFTNTSPALPAGATSGVFVGCVVSLAPPFDVIPAGTGAEIALMDYAIDGGAMDGDTTTIDFSDQVGQPPVAVVISVNGGSTPPDEVVSGSITVQGVATPNFIRGDSNDDGIVDVSDVVHLAKWLFGVGPANPCDDAGDVNDNGALDAIDDPLFLIAYLFQNGPAPAAPFPACGPDGTGMDGLDCMGTSCP